MSSISANDLKTKGVAAIESVLEKHPEAVISVRGKERFVVWRWRTTTTCANASWVRPSRKRAPTSQPDAS